MNSVKHDKHWDEEKIMSSGEFIGINKCDTLI